MITPAYAQLMAAYNKWQNDSLYGAASGLSDEERRRDRGAFFKSIHGTLCHLLWGDETWLSRFSDFPKPAATEIPGSPDYYRDWSALREARLKTDQAIAEWAGALAPGDLEGDLSWYSGAMKREITKPRWRLIVQMFNHQTHHRGQVHAMLTAAGAKPDDTDIQFLP